VWGNAVGSPPTRSPSLSGLGAGELTRQQPSLLALAGRPKVVPFPFLHTTRMEDAMKLRYALAMAALSSTAVGMAVHTLRCGAGGDEQRVHVRALDLCGEGFELAYVANLEPLYG
jgi:hypothetical protein